MKIALCSPIHDVPKAGFAYSLDRMLIATARALTDQGEMERFVVRNSLVTDARNSLYQSALKWGADYLLWMDADHSFPPNALLRLLSHKRAAVAVNYRKRIEQIMPVASKRLAEGFTGWMPVFSNRAKAAADEVEEVDRVGLGFFLLDMKATAAALADHPVFEMQTRPKLVGEDSLFCDRLRAAGHKIYVDHALSMQVGHIHEVALLFPD